MPDGSVVLVVNPAAGHGRAGRQWPTIARTMKAAGWSFEAVFTEKEGDGTRLAAAALRDGATLVVAVGGDGTANEVANGFFVTDQPGALVNPAARFGFIPVGTGTDLARCLGLRRGSAAIAALGPGGRTTTVDVALARYQTTAGPLPRYFLVGADLGVGGETAAMARSTARWTTPLGGFGAYLVAATLAILRHRPRAIRYAIDDEAFVPARTDIVFVANGRFIGGGMLVAPSASMEDGLLDVLVLRAVSRPDLLFRLLPGIYRGTHLKHPAVLHCRARRVVVESTELLLLQMDGEQVGTAPAAFEVIPRVLPVAAPADEG